MNFINNMDKRVFYCIGLQGYYFLYKKNIYKYVSKTLIIIQYKNVDT